VSARFCIRAFVGVLVIGTGIEGGCAGPEGFHGTLDATAGSSPSAAGSSAGSGGAAGAAGAVAAGSAGALGLGGASGGSGAGGSAGAAGIGPGTGGGGTIGGAGVGGGAGTNGGPGTGGGGAAAGAGGAGGVTGLAGTNGSAGAGSVAGSGGGGSTGAGGAAGVSGAAGTGGSAGQSVTGACAGKVVAAAMLIANFENGSLTNWYEYKDSTPGSTLAPLAIVSPGANGTSKAIQLSGSGFQGFGAGMGDMMICTDASAFQGITFWAKGTSGTSNQIALQVAIPQTQAVADFGDCTSKCYDHPSKKVTLATSWQQYSVKFTDLAQAGFGNPASYAGIIMALNWVSIEGPTVDFQVDEISFY
jgi:hypothetical protein